MQKSSNPATQSASVRPDVTYQHPTLAAGRWAEMSLAEQMGNIGSEVSRALLAKNRGKPDRMKNALFRALELFDLSLIAHRNSPSRLQELCRAREELCDYFLGDNTFQTDPIRLQKYYDQFISLIPKETKCPAP